MNGCTTLVASNTPGGANTAGGIKSTQLYIKKAYLQANYADYFNVRFGGADTPWIPFVEGIYGYRFAEKVLVDRNNYGTSADWGLNFYGAFLDKIVSYSLSVVDGEGYKQPALGNQNRTQSMDFEGRVNATYKHFTVAVGGYDGKLGNDVYGVYTYNNGERFDALLAYTDAHFRFGAEYLWARYWKDVTQPNALKTNETTGYSIFASYNINPQFSVFGKGEWLKPLGNTLPSETTNYFNVGLDYKPIGPARLRPRLQARSGVQRGVHGRQRHDRNPDGRHPRAGSRPRDLRRDRRVFAGEVLATQDGGGGGDGQTSPRCIWVGVTAISFGVSRHCH